MLINKKTTTIFILLFSIYSHAQLNQWTVELNGAWHDPNVPGQGFIIDHNINRNIMLVGWFTYPISQQEPIRGQSTSYQWYTMQGSTDGAQADLTIYQTTGGIFNQSSEVTHHAIGNATLTLLDCNTAEIEYSIKQAENSISNSILLTKSLALSQSTCSEIANSIAMPKEIDHSNTIAIKNVNIIPMTETALLTNQTVIIKNQKIVKIGPTETTMIEDNSTVINANNKYLMPGINDMHTHLTGSISQYMGTFIGHELWNSNDRIIQTYEARYSELMLYLAKGVTSILNTGDFGENLPQWSSMIKNDQLIGPSIYSSHYVRGNRPNCQNGPPHTVANNGEAALSLLRSAQEKGYDFVKVYKCAPQEAVMALLNEQNTSGLPVIGHFPIDISAKFSVEHGMKAAAHLWEISHSDILTEPSSESIKLASDFIVENDFTIISTLLIYELLAQVWGNDPVGVATYWNDPENIYMHPTTVKLNQRNFEQGGYGPIGSSNAYILQEVETLRVMIKQFIKDGSTILLGTDSPGLLGVAGFSAHDEMRAMKRAGLNEHDILTIATKNGAQFIMKNVPDSDAFGQISEGFRADLILLDANPLDNINIEDNIIAVIARGTWRSHEYFDEKLAEIAEMYQNK